MDRKILTSRQYFKLLSLIYGVMLVAQVGTGAVFFFLRSTQADVMQDDAELAQIFRYFAPIFALVIPSVGIMLAKKSLRTILANEPLSDKLRKYQSSLLLKYAFFEASTFLTLIAYFVTGDKLLLGIGAGLVLWFLTQIPTKNQLFDEVPLLPLEESKLNNPEAEVAEMPVRD